MRSFGDAKQNCFQTGGHFARIVAINKSHSHTINGSKKS